MIADGGRRRSTEAFFGRRRGKRVRPLQAAALQAGLDRYRLDIGLPPPGRLEDLFEAAVSEVRLEIGFGGGEHLVNEAVRHRWTGFLGVEPFVNSMAKMMAALADLPLPNLRVYDDDATRLLDWLPAASLSGIDLLYPDPWPKKKHWKRRFVNPANLQRFGRVLKRGGSLRFASDIPSYVNWTLLACAAHGGFEWLARDSADWHTPFEGWEGTRYEAKALREGRCPAYLTFARA
ncbi:MAG: hypothetical protein K0S21_612 [Rhizobiaceae bacterium]|nr:hypothetical protein [Rhizobiaceae bacterium]